MMPSNTFSAENDLIEQNYKTLSELDCHMYTSVSSTRGAEVVVIAIHEWDRNRAVIEESEYEFESDRMVFLIFPSLKSLCSSVP